VTVPESTNFASWRALSETGDFEAVLAALEESVALLERGGLPLATMTECYELGLKLSRRCTTLLREAELRIFTLDQEYADQQQTATSDNSSDFEVADDTDEDPPF
jgi:exodeoxyribonuclease VII small subunit